ncbi:MAG: hypothetical protein LWX70_04255 [Sphingobacteriia bacterium]|nr:hypothetical protein [Sphingobacteriia bacterium]
MKKVLFSIAIILVFAGSAFAQPNPNTNSNGSQAGGASGGAPLSGSGGGAPIDGGIAILLTLGAAYGAGKIWNTRKKIAE